MGPLQGSRVKIRGHIIAHRTPLSSRTIWWYVSLRMSEPVDDKSSLKGAWSDASGTTAAFVRRDDGALAERYRHTRGDQKVLQFNYKTVTQQITHAVIFHYILLQHQCIA